MALQFQPIETIIEQSGPVITKVIQSEGPYPIPYNTTGPSILAFEKDCDDGKGSFMYYCGIDLKYDEKRNYKSQNSFWSYATNRSR